MKILHVNKFFDLRDGTSAYLHALMEQQRAAGHEVHAFSTRSPENLPSPDASYFVERFDLKQREGAFEEMRIAAAYIWNREARRSMIEMLREIKPDVVHLHNIYHHISTSILGPIRNSGAVCVQTLHDYKLACPNYKMYTEGAPCERCKGGHYLEAVKHHCLTADLSGNLLAAIEMGYTKLVQSYERTVGAFLCPSQFMADKMAAWGEPPSKLHVLPNPIGISATRALGDGEYLLAIGRLSIEKGFETIVRAAAVTPQIELRIAGTGPEEARLKHLAASLGVRNVVFLGFLRQPELALQRQHAMAIVVPSVWYENAPYAVLEAMAEGIPIIASRIGGLPEQVEAGVNGLLVDPGNVEAWVDAFRDMAALPVGERLRMGEQGIQKALQRHSWQKHAEQLFLIYRALGAV